jgi:acyl-CoA thioesterase
MRPLVDLVAGETMSPVQRVMACVDSASGVSAALDPASWGFLNTELTVHVLRPPVGDWVCVDAETTLGSGSVGIATSSVYDERGLVARSGQALLVAKRA